jgi:hypothetical protein
MPDEDVTLQNFLDMHPGLAELSGLWRRSGDPLEQFRNCLLLMEALAKETRIWLFSRLAASGEFPRQFLTPRAAGVFGTDVGFLQQFQNHRFLSQLAGAEPPRDDGFVPLRGVIGVFKNYHEQYDEASFKRALTRFPLNREDTWLATLGHFVTCRNLEGHQVSQVDSGGAPIIITARIRECASGLAESLARWVPWMIRQAANTLGGYRLRSRGEVSSDNHYALHALCEKQGFSTSTATTWYVLCDDRRQPLELFSRLETDEQIRAAVKRLDDGTESALFDSAAKGVLLPLIGPAFGLPDQPNSPGAKEVIQRARDVIGDPRFESSNDSLKDFLARIIAARLNFAVPDLASPSRRQGNTSARLAGDLASLALHASMSLGRSMSTSGSPLTGGSEALTQQDIEMLSKRISDVIATIRTLTKEVPANERIDLGADGVEELLQWLRDEVTDGHLSLTTVARLADMVWHALRWDAPLYPDAEALDVQLWLGTPRDANTRRAIYDRTPASSGAALLIDPAKLAEYFEGWSRRLEKTMSEALSEARGWWRDPHGFVAEAMAECLEKRRGTPLGTEKPEDKENVFIVDATFDRRICLALAEARVPAAVVYPVDLEDIHKQKFPGWAIRRFPAPEKQVFEEYSILWDGIGRAIYFQDVPRVIVIKPFGAPLEPIDQLASAAKTAIDEFSAKSLPLDIANRITVKRRYLFDDVSILNDLVRRQDSMPPGFRDALHQPYSNPFELYFLGYSLEEYGRRARMLADVRPTGWDGVSTSGSLLYFSEPPPSGLVSPYLKGAGIDHYDMSLRTAMHELDLRLGRRGRAGAGR